MIGQNPQRVESESCHEPLRVARPNPFDHAGAEIFLDAFEGRRIDLLPVIDLKLQAVARMAFPYTGHFDLFAFGDRKNRPDDRDPGAAFFIETRHGVMGVRMLVGNPADGALNRGCFVVFFAHRQLPCSILLETPYRVNDSACVLQDRR